MAWWSATRFLIARGAAIEQHGHVSPRRVPAPEGSVRLEALGVTEEFVRGVGEEARARCREAAEGGAAADAVEPPGATIHRDPALHPDPRLWCRQGLVVNPV